MPPSLNLNKVSTHDIDVVLKCTKHKLVELSNKTTKLYIDLTLLGGVTNIFTYIEENPEENKHLMNSKISEHLISNIPQNTFTWVQVQNCKYNFFNQGKVPARVIKLKPGDSGWEVFKNSLAILFGRNNSHPTNTYNTNSIGNAILGVEQTDEGLKQLKELYESKRIILIYLSLDNEHFYVDIESSDCVIL